jgi:cysteinyl-tRNA synthetase
MDVIDLIKESGKRHLSYSIDFDELVEGLMQTILDLRKEAKLNKDWPTADKIRNDLGEMNIEVKDTKEGAVWNKKG